jgi:uncharacterized membrane protein YqiK
MIVLYIFLGIIALIGVGCLIVFYRIVDPSEAHLVATPRGKFVASADENVGTERTYFAIPSWIPFFGRAIRIMDVTIKEIKFDQETIEKNQARYDVTSSTKYRTKDVKQAAETFINNKSLVDMLTENIKAGIRAVTVNFEVQDARAKKQEIEDGVRKQLESDFKKWGLELINFQLVEFKDTAKSKIISNISLRSEIEIESRTREQNAEKIKQAKIKEAEADEKAQEREIERDRVVGEKQQLKIQKIAEMEKLAEEKRFEVVQVQTIKQAKIDKEKAIIEANMNKETEEINKEQLKLEGEGYRLKAEEQAKGDAAPILEKGFAEAKVKDELQKALKQFDDIAIRALTAELIVAKEQAVGVATAEALSKADVKVFSGGGKNGENGFELGKMISSMSVSNEGTADAVLNKIARSNDMGFKTLGLKSIQEKTETEKTKVNKKQKTLNK